MTAKRVDYFSKFRVNLEIEYIDRSGSLAYLYLKSASVSSKKEAKLVGAIFLEQFYADYDKNWSQLPAMYRKHAKKHGRPLAHIERPCEIGRSNFGCGKYENGKIIW